MTHTDGRTEMAQRTQPAQPSGTGRPPAGRTSGSRGRKPAPVKQPFPVALVLGSVALAAVLIGVIVFAVVNQGSGAKNPLAQADKLSGLVKSDTTKLKSAHVTGPVSYPDQAGTPPVGGNHNAVPETCAVYSQQIPNEHAVHSMEHGAAWVTYRPDLPVSQLATLKGEVNGNPYRLMSPYPALKSAISLQAWGRQLFVDSASDKRVKEFLGSFTNGPTTPEKGASCSGTSQTGTTPGAAQK